MTRGKKEAAPVLQHQSGQVETRVASQTTPYLQPDFTTAAVHPSSIRVANLLLPGQHNAVPRRFINSMLHRAAEIAKTAAALERAEV